MGGGRFGPMVKKIGGEGILCLFCSFLFFVSNKNKKKKKTGGEQFQKWLTLTFNRTVAYKTLPGLEENDLKIKANLLNINRARARHFFLTWK